MELLTLSIKVVYGYYLQEPCTKVIEIGTDADLDDLHEAILHFFDFDRDHMFEFYLANNPFPRAQKQRLLEYDEDLTDFPDYSGIKIVEALPTGKKILYYRYDFGDNWIFEIRKARVKAVFQPDAAYPRLVETRGPNPEQYPMCDEE